MPFGEDDELLQALLLAASQPEKPEYLYNEAQNFVLAVGMKVGIDQVPVLFIWNLYTKWCLDRNHHQNTKSAFFKQFSRIFVSYRNRKGRYYHLDGKLFDLTNETTAKLMSLQGERKRHRPEKRKKLNKQKEKDYLESLAEKAKDSKKEDT